jgi:hypothetical protein
MQQTAFGIANIRSIYNPAGPIVAWRFGSGFRTQTYRLLADFHIRLAAKLLVDRQLGC